MKKVNTYFEIRIHAPDIRSSTDRELRKFAFNINPPHDVRYGGIGKQTIPLNIW